MKQFVLLLLFLVSSLFGQSLQNYTIDKEHITISGLSSGGAFASQFHVAFSSSLSGAAILAGPPYDCAQGKLVDALVACMSSPMLINVKTLTAAAEQGARSGAIDATSNLNNTQVYLLSGTKDSTVKQGVMEATYQFYQHFMHESNIQREFSLPAEHAWITDDWGNACGFSGKPWINNCNYDAAGVFLKQFYGDLNPRTTPDNSRISSFDQSKYTPKSPNSISLANKGYIYVPKKCEDPDTVCKLHVSFHGCQQYAGNIGDVYYTRTGLNNWAESNNIIVLYPQTDYSYFPISNPNGCWDWWGYDGADYIYKSGSQMTSVANMINALVGDKLFKL